jgi:hypothetical protein
MSPHYTVLVDVTSTNFCGSFNEMSLIPNINVVGGPGMGSHHARTKRLPSRSKECSRCHQSWGLFLVSRLPFVKLRMKMYANVPKPFLLHRPRHTVLPSMDITYQVLPSMDITYQVLPSMDITYQVLPSMDIMYQVLPSMDIMYQVLPSMDIMYQVLPSMDIMYQDTLNIKRLPRTNNTEQTPRSQLELPVYHLNFKLF